MTPLDPLGIELRGVQLIEASAGTGKTHTIATLVVRHVLERNLLPDRILVVTFTTAATAELRDRIRKRLREALLAFQHGSKPTDAVLSGLLDRNPDRNRARKRLEQALELADEAAVHTIHGFCQLVLREQAFEGGLRPGYDLLPDISPLIDEIVHDFWTARVGTASRPEVEFLRTKRIDAKTLFHLGLRAVRTADAPVVVDAAARRSGATAHFLALKKRAASEWASCRSAVSNLLRHSDALNGNSYRQSVCDTLIEAIDELCASDERALGPRPEKLDKLTPASLRTGTKKGKRTPGHPFFSTCEELVTSRAGAEAELTAFSQELFGDFVSHVRNELTRRARSQSLQHFDDLLHSLRGALRGPRGKALAAAVRRRFPAALIDEFHDTDPVQYEIFDRIYRSKGAGLFLIGDPKQAIYAFRGADVFAYIKAARSARACHTLTVNHRSDPTLVGAVNTLFSRSKAPFLLEDIRFERVGTPSERRDRLSLNGRPWSGLDLLLIRRDPSHVSGKQRAISRDAFPGIVAKDIVNAIASGARLDDRPIAAADFAVLTRTNAEAYDIQRALRAHGVPAVFQGDTSVLDTEEAAEVAEVLRALADPGSGAKVRTALATTLLSLDAAELFRLGENEAAWERWAGDFARWHGVWEQRGFLSAARQLMEEHRVSARLLATVGGERKLTNFLHLVELCHRQAEAFGLGIAGLLAWFDEVRHDDEARKGLSGDEQQIRLESDAKAVQLTTMHRSKGLEYPIVYLPHLGRSARLFGSDRQQLAYHDPERQHRLVLDLRPEDEKPKALLQGEEEATAEALRLAYVALTRAKHRTVVLWAALSDFEHSAMARLLHPLLTSLGTLRASSDDVIRQDLEELCQDAGGGITLRDFELLATSSDAAASLPATVDLVAAEPRRILSLSFRTSSFSALAAATPHTADDGRDLDPAAEADVATVLPESTAVEMRIPLDDFPRGPRAGDVVHAILEHADWDTPDGLRLAVRDHLEQRGLDADRWTDVLAASLRDALDTQLLPGEQPLALGRVPRRHRLPEMEFTFPVGAVKRRGAGMLTAQALARALAKNPVLPKAYTEKVAALPFAPLCGFLRGFIDLVFEHEGRFYVVDYKSNHLGSFASDYATTHLADSMAEHHYFLQYHLYVVALHRHLRRKVPWYEYDRHFGGVFYLYLRGMASNRGCEAGVFSDRPDHAIVESLSQCLSVGAGEHS